MGCGPGVSDCFSSFLASFWHVFGQETFKSALDQCAQLLEGHALLEPTGDLRDILFAEGAEAALRYDQPPVRSRFSSFSIDFPFGKPRGKQRIDRTRSMVEESPRVFDSE